MSARINLLSLDGIELSDHGRTFTQDRVDRITQIELANGNRKQYVKGIKRKFNIEWTWLPSADAQTSDTKAGRDTLRGLLLDGNTHTLIVRDMASGSTNTYTVFVDSYNETIKRRDNPNNLHYYDISVEFSQQ